MSIREDIVLDPTKGIQGLDEMDRATIKYARKQERLWRKNQENIDAIGEELQRLKRLRDTANDPRSVKRYNKAIDKLEKEQQELRQESERYGRAVKESSQEAESGFKKVGRAAKAWIAGVALSAIYALQRGLRKVISVTSEFEEGMAEVSTLVDTNEVSMAALNDGLQDIATTVSGTNWNDLPKALYQTISAGIDAGDALQVVETSARSAVAGVTEVSVAVDGITTAINAWGMEADRAEQVSDAFFTAVKAGKTTFDELSQSIGQAAPLAAAAGSSLEEVLSATAALTTSGLDTAKSMVALRGIFQKIIKPTQQAKQAADELGIEFNQAALESKGLYGFLQDVAEAADGNTEILGRLFEDVRALNGVLALTGETSGTMARILEDMEGNAGATNEAFAKMEDNFNNLYELFQNKLNRVMVKFGNQVMPSVIQALEDAGNMLDKMAQNGEDFQFIQHFVDEFNISGKQLGQFTGSVKSMLKDHRQRFQGLKTDLQDYIGMIEEYNRMLAEDDISEERRESILRAREKEIAKLEEERKISKKIVHQARQKLKHQKDDAEYQAKWTIKLQAAQQSLDYINNQMDSLKRSQQDVNNNQQNMNQQLSWEATLKGYADFQDYLNEIIMLGRQIPTAELNTMATTVGDINQQMQQWAQGDVMGALMRGAAGNIEQYNQALTEAHNELKSGLITQEEYEQKVKKATDTFLDQVKEIYKSIKDDLTPAQQELFKEWLSNVEDVNEKTGETESSLSDIADTADALINVADAFGQIGDQARKSLRGISDVLRNVEQLRNLSEDAGFFQSIMPAIGVAGGIMSIASGIAKGDPRQTELINQLQSLERQLRKNTEALREQAVVGSDISQAQIEQVKILRDRLEGLVDEAQNTSWGDVGGLVKEIGDTLDELSNMGVEALEGFDQDLFESLLAEAGGDISKIDDILKKILEGSENFEGLNDVLDMIMKNLGQFGDSLEGAIKQFDMATKLGMDTEEAFNQFIDDVQRLIGEDNEITSLLEDLKEANSEEERKALAEEIWNAFQENPTLLGSDLTGSDLQEIIDVILRQESVSGSEAGGGFSRSVQIARTITDVQANEMIMFLERIEKWTRDTAAQLGSKTAQSVNESGGMMPDLSIPIPLEVQITNSAVPVKVLNSFGGGGNSSSGDKKNINIGDINIGRDGITDGEIDEIAQRFSDKLKRELRGSQF